MPILKTQKFLNGQTVSTYGPWKFGDIVAVDPKAYLTPPDPAEPNDRRWMVIGIEAEERYPYTMIELHTGIVSTWSTLVGFELVERLA